MSRIVAVIFISLLVLAARAQDQSRIEFRVNVTDQYGRSFSGLKTENFLVTENGSERKIVSARIDDKPASVTILIDISDSITPKLRQSLIRSVWKFISVANPDNDYSILAFGKNVYPLIDWKTPRETMKSKLEELGNVKISGENTGFFDGFAAGVEKAASGTLDRKVLIVYSDGQDNQSDTPFKRLQTALKQSNLVVYGVSIAEPRDIGRSDYLLGKAALDELTAMTGGRALYPYSDLEAVEIGERIADYLKYQYVIEWETTLPPKDSKWRSVKIKAVVPKEKGGKMSVRTLAREGYFPDYVRIAK